MSNVRVIPAHEDTPPFEADDFGRFVPERFVSFSEDEMIEAEAHAAWGEWLELTFDPDYATCMHGMSADLCDGPNHYPADRWDD